MLILNPWYIHGWDPQDRKNTCLNVLYFWDCIQIILTAPSKSLACLSSRQKCVGKPSFCFASLWFSHWFPLCYVCHRRGSVYVEPGLELWWCTDHSKYMPVQFFRLHCTLRWLFSRIKPIGIMMLTTDALTPPWENVKTWAAQYPKFHTWVLFYHHLVHLW